MLSNTAYQNLTYLCRNSIAYNDAAINSNSKAIKLLSNDEMELVASSVQPKLQYQVLVDHCRHRSNSTESTVIEYRTGKLLPKYSLHIPKKKFVLHYIDLTKRLPLLDIGVRDIGEASQEFGLEIGPVCFI